MPLLIYFNIPLTPALIPNWRGAVSDLARQSNTLTQVQKDLFYQHDNSEEGQGKVIHRYPLIQYRVMRGEAVIWATQEGITALRIWLGEYIGKYISVKGREHLILINNIDDTPNAPQLLDTRQEYRLYDWLALNSDNYKAWQQAEGLSARVTLLEKSLLGNLDRYLHVMGHPIYSANAENTRLELLNHTRPVRLHGVEHIAFEVLFSSLWQLPTTIAIGKGCSMGYGTCFPFSTPK